MKIEILLFDGFDDLDAFGPFEVFANAKLDATFVTAEPVDYVTSAGGARIVPDSVMGDPDLVLVPGGGWNDRSGKGAYYESRRGVITAKLRERHAARRRVGSVCTGAMVLAEAGILTGRRATTHHESHEELKGYEVDVIEDARYVDEGDIITSAGITAGIDMALHLVEQALGADAAAAGIVEIEWDRRTPTPA